VNVGRNSYRVVVADPPWDYGQMKPRTQAHRGGNPQSHYATMTVGAICALPVADLADTDAALFLWVTNPKLPLGFAVMDAWGFKYQTTLTWIKTRQDGGVDRGGMGFYFRGATEHVLFGTRGRFQIDTGAREPNIFMAPRQGHSAKPEALQDAIERISDGPYVELFARRERMGWDTWGNEALNHVELIA
jgi:N6-adenosine-specific RNA methylase IME4